MLMGKRLGLALLVIALSNGVLDRVAAQNARTGADATAETAQGASQKKVVDAADVRKFTSPQLDRLELLVGVWKVKETHYDRRGDVAATVQGSEEIRWILDGHAIHRDYQTETGSGLYRALGTLTYNAGAGEYRGVWFDNASNAGPTYVQGEWQPDSQTMVFTMESLGPNGKASTYRIVEQYPDADRRVTTTYLLRGADIVKRMQVDYVRAVPCPARIRGVWGELAGGKND